MCIHHWPVQFVLELSSSERDRKDLPSLCWSIYQISNHRDLKSGEKKKQKACVKEQNGVMNEVKQEMKLKQLKISIIQDKRIKCKSISKRKEICKEIVPMGTNLPARNL